MNLKTLSHQELLSETKIAVHDERLSTIKVLHHFREIERRRTYLGYSSLFELAVKHFGYSAAGAQRRISSMRLLRELPEFESKIESGELSLSAAASAQSYFKRSRPSRAHKIELVSACINKSTREVDKEIKRRDPESDKRADIRYSSENRLRMSVNISEDTYEKLENLKYKLRCSNIDEVISRLANQALSLDTTSPVTPKKDTRVNAVHADDRHAIDAVLLPAPEVKARHIPIVTRKIVIKRSDQKCTYKNPYTGEECTKTEKLEFDHIHPFSKGGPHLPENLRLVCSHHNKQLWHTEQKNI